ncbi:MAG: DNA gyrase subunit A [Endomicrobium sp.]|jgi:DNA gyrase subunit A|nr:DNA gyrase subunit A [Endomicrobium sp.]
MSKEKITDDNKQKNLHNVQNEIIVSCDIEREMKDSYINYAMSVIVSRALPDVRDGLKPVHRRIIYAMNEMNLKYNTSYKKSARVVGNVLGKYHPHGDTAVYNAIVRMVQTFSLRYPLIDGHGNFGSIDGDSAAAMRYTEIRMGHITNELLVDLDKDTVDFIHNYDSSLKEPVILPVRIPNLLINGASGIAVGMATNIPPHNIGEVCDALLALLNDKNITTEKILHYIQGPDFPTGGVILGTNGILNYMTSGKGILTLRAKIKIIEKSNNNERECIIINEIPYQINKSTLLTSIINLVKTKKIESIYDIRDESDRNGIRIVIELKKDMNAKIVLNQLYKYTQLESSFGVIMLALVDNKPKIMGIKDLLIHHIKHRKDIIVKRVKFDLHAAIHKKHILEGFKVAIQNIDGVLQTIKEAINENNAKLSLSSKFNFTPIQANSILEMKIRRLTKLNRDAINDDYVTLSKLIKNFNEILCNPKNIISMIKEEILLIKKKYADIRKTTIQFNDLYNNKTIEDFIQDEDFVITMSHSGYIKRIPVNTYRVQHRGGRGITAMITKEEDFVKNLFITNSHSYMLFFTTYGKVYWLKVYDIPLGTRISKGKAIINLLHLTNMDERITAAIDVKSFVNNSSLLMCTKSGIIKKVSLKEFSKPRKNGINAIKLKDSDILIEAKVVSQNFEIIIATKMGMAIRFKESDVRLIGRNAIGVKGISIKKSDEVIGMEVVNPNDILLSVSENGYGKKTKVNKYRSQHRGGYGIINMHTGKRNGNIISITKTSDNKEVMLITKNGITIRLGLSSIPLIGRITKGVKLVKLDHNDKVVATSILRI